MMMVIKNEIPTDDYDKERPSPSAGSAFPIHHHPPLPPLPPPHFLRSKNNFLIILVPE